MNTMNEAAQAQRAAPLTLHLMQPSDKARWDAFVETFPKAHFFHKAGLMEAGEGLHPTSKGARIKYSGGQSTLSRGPFELSGDLIAGFWLIKTKSLDEAIGWMKRAP